MLSYQQPAAGGELDPLFLLHRQMSSCCWKIERCMLVLVSTNTSASVCVSDVHVAMCRSPLACPSHPRIPIDLCVSVHYEATMKGVEQRHAQTTDISRQKKKEERK